MAGFRGLAAWLIGVLLVAGCAGLPPDGPPRETPERLVIPLAGDAVAHAVAVAERARHGEVVYLGEMHDNPRHHAIQTSILEALLARDARPGLAFEMLAEGQQAAVDEALTTARTAAEVERRLRWRARGWPDFQMYWPLFYLARRHRLPVLAVDLEPTLARRITRGGLAALGDVAPRLASRLPADRERDAAIARTMQAAHCELLTAEQLARMVESWHARNVAIARGIAEALPQAGPIVVIIGRGHQAEGGVPAQLEALRPGTRQLVLEMLEVAAGETADAVAERGTGDVVWLTPAVRRADPCARLRPHLVGSDARPSHG